MWTLEGEKVRGKRAIKRVWKFGEAGWTDLSFNTTHGALLSHKSHGVFGTALAYC